MDNLEKENLPEEEDVLEEENTKKSRKWIIVLVVILLCFLIAIGGTVIWAVAYIKGIFKFNYNEITSDPVELGYEEKKEDEIINIALFGLDTKNPNSFKGLSDSIMILSINTDDNTVKLISVMRDSFVPMTLYTGKVIHNKINSAYSTGGPEFAIKTLNTIFDLDISEYATVNFYGMADIIETLGGIDVTLTEDEIYFINGGIREQCSYLGIDPEPLYIESSGQLHLNGIQAVAYSRIRYAANSEGTANDYGRTDRQRYVLQQLFNKAAGMGYKELIELAKTLAPFCETSLTHSEIISIAADVLLEKPTFSETRVPDQKYLMRAPATDAGSIVYYDLEFAAKLIHAYIYKDVVFEDYIAVNGIQQNDWYSAGFVAPEIDDETLMPSVEDEVSQETTE